MINRTRTILSQYDNSPTIRAIIESIMENIDPTKNIEDFYKLVFDLDTAQGFGLDVWGRIVGVGRVLNVEDTDAHWGFSQALAASFGDGTFKPVEAVTSSYALSDDAYRNLIYVKALANISTCDADSLNRLLSLLFDRGNAYINDYGDMSIRYVFEFDATAYERAIILSGVLPRPAGVSTSAINLVPLHTFGFSGTGAGSFGDGVTFVSTRAFL